MVEETLDPGPAGHTLQLVRTGEELEAAARARLHYPASLALGRLLDTRVTRSVFRGPFLQTDALVSDMLRTIG